MSACPDCGQPLAAEAKVCRHCLHVIDRVAWAKEHDAGRLGADDRGGGRPLEDPPVGPLPLTGGGMIGLGSAAGALGGALRSIVAVLIARSRRGRR